MKTVEYEKTTTYEIYRNDKHDYWWRIYSKLNREDAIKQIESERKKNPQHKWMIYSVETTIKRMESPL